MSGHQQNPESKRSSAVSRINVPQIFPGHRRQFVDFFHLGGRLFRHPVAGKKAGEMERDLRIHRGQPGGQTPDFLPAVIFSGN